MKRNSMTIDQYAVIGNPITHSLSPLIHQLFAEQTGQQLSYQPILVPREGFIEAVLKFQQAGGMGLNITLPFKENAWQIATLLSQRAVLAKAVNTLSFTHNNQIFGDNTDGIGLCRDLEKNLSIPIVNKKILILGAGGAVRGILHPLLDNNPAHILIANRTKEKAIALAQAFSNQKVTGCQLTEVGHAYFDIVINAIPNFLHAVVPSLPTDIILSEGCCYDLSYGKKDTNPFLLWGKKMGATQLFDGIGMLVEQAAESFYLWRNIRPSTKPVIKKLIVLLKSK